MVNYICKCCNYETTRKSSYEKHINSDKHKNIENRDNISSISGDETKHDNTTNNSIVELEYQLKMKENEIQNIINEYTLKLQMKDLEIKHKDDIILSLQKQLQQQQIQRPVEQHPEEEQPVQLIITEQPNAKRPSVKTSLEIEFKNSPSIEKCYKELINTPEHNNFIQSVELPDETEVNILNPDKSRLSYYQNSSNISTAIEIIKGFIKTFSKQELPFYCSDKRRNVLHLKTENGWIKETEDNKNEFDNHLLQFGRSALFSITNCCHKMETLFKKSKLSFHEFYNMHFDIWRKDHMIDIICIISPYSSNEDECVQINEKLIHKIKLLFCEMSKKTIQNSETEEI
jgi:hypothetical protein